MRRVAQHEPRIHFGGSKYWQTHAAAVGIMNGRMASRFPRELRQVGTSFSRQTEKWLGRKRREEEAEGDR